jgi:hypothetical protein
MLVRIPHDDLWALEDRVQTALRTADDRALDVLGYGEVTLVLKLTTTQGAYACKRLPVFPTPQRYERYENTLADYLAKLDRAGINAAPTQLWQRRLSGGRIVAYCVQQALPADRLCSRLLHTEPQSWATDFFKRFLDHVDRAVSPSFGLDAQAANWIDLDGELTYLDVTTPLLRDAHGREQLDVPLFLTSLPWILRDAVRLTMSKSIFDKFYSTRGALLDFLGNLHKERLERLIPPFVELANARLSTPITAHEVASYYRDDARMWEMIQRLRKADRFWHRTVLRRTYPFLLPPDIDR